MDQLRKAAEAVITHVVGDLPVHGWLSDNDASRRALSQLRAALAAAPAAVVQAEPSEVTEQAIAEAVRDWFPDRANQSEYFARAVITGQKHWTKRHLDTPSGTKGWEPA